MNNRGNINEVVNVYYLTKTGKKLCFASDIVLMMQLVDGQRPFTLSDITLNRVSNTQIFNSIFHILNEIDLDKNAWNFFSIFKIVESKIKNALQIWKLSLAYINFKDIRDNRKSNLTMSTENAYKAIVVNGYFPTSTGKQYQLIIDIALGSIAYDSQLPDLSETIIEYLQNCTAKYSYDEVIHDETWFTKISPYIEQQLRVLFDTFEHKIRAIDISHKLDHEIK